MTWQEEQYNLKMQGETLKQKVWAFMEDKDIDHVGVKGAMNELLDLLDELSEPEDE